MFHKAHMMAIVFACAAAIAGAQAFSPMVQMSVTMPDGQTKTLSAPESGLVVQTVNGTEYGFRPTILDAKPWNHVVVTVFKMATSSQPTQELGEVDLKTGAPAVQSKTTPAFKIAVTKVSPPGTQS